MKEGIPEKRIFPPYEDQGVTERKFAAMKSYLEGNLDFVSAEHRPTPFDFQGLNPDSKEKDFLRWIEKEMGIKPEIILADGNSPESIQTYRLLNYAYQRARNFLRDTLKYSEKEIFKDIEVKSISSKEDIFNLFKRVKLIADKGGLNQSIKYCRIVKATLATYETLRNDSKLLKKITEDFEKSLVSSPEEDSNTTDTPFVFSGKYNAVGKGFYTTENSEIEGTINSRDKGEKDVVIKYIISAGANAESALKDGIGSRITIEKNQAVEMLPILLERLTKEMKVTNIKIENKSFFSAQQIKKLPKNLNILGDDKSNPLTGGKFEALFIRGKLHSSSHGGQFEIQLVDPDNKNEVDDMDHDTYCVKKFVTARTRLDGGCPQDVFEEFVKDAHIKSGISIKKIKHDLLDVPDAAIFKKIKKNGKYVYFSHAIYKRWAEFKWIDESLYSEIQDVHK